ncbi:hypothetical protein A3K86_20640 [Photobacterium jeanii]|uniref:Nucleotidyl transferase domain-containing protein n=1 Tax=Photobacterium jeanii TaxID=858640 RepID=A0A178K1Z8_9GAMM|nr:nucleotidyltransferase family protein [Photobacterium jeanii]OAN11359.1 hypothetical protein A3K86_20640 [Photobacterium jeanii]PST90879.1 D-glycero-D-manno-heptose 1-phosphate guanosyltransferase [Photobacterium jeanii]
MEVRTTCAIILCGGLGTRLSSITQGKPKPMVDVAGRPFLEYQLDYLKSQGVQRVVMAVSHRREAIETHFGHHYQGLSIEYAIENSPLGTGGAIKNALTNCQIAANEDILILNGDTFVEFQLANLQTEKNLSDALLFIATKEVSDTERYGKVTFDNQMRITGFQEKQPGTKGAINAGVYLTTKALLQHLPVQALFSFETDFLYHQVEQRTLQAHKINGFFIDIGIPEDYHAFCELMQTGQITCPS